VYPQLLARQFICSPTMLMRRVVLDELGGYDESLSYEDYDFWVRSGRNYRYHYLDEILTAKRQLPHSHTQSFYRLRENAHLQSTLRVCQKAQELNRTTAEDAALAVSVRYHLRLAFFTENFDTARQLYALLQKLVSPHLTDRIVYGGSRWRLPLGHIYRAFQYLRRIFRGRR
jgi:hypothetical protein